LAGGYLAGPWALIQGWLHSNMIGGVDSTCQQDGECLAHVEDAIGAKTVLCLKYPIRDVNPNSEKRVRIDHSTSDRERRRRSTRLSLRLNRGRRPRRPLSLLLSLIPLMHLARARFVSFIFEPQIQGVDVMLH
jgi:hypothetical protein